MTETIKPLSVQRKLWEANVSREVRSAFKQALEKQAIAVGGARIDVLKLTDAIQDQIMFADDTISISKVSKPVQVGTGKYKVEVFYDTMDDESGSVKIAFELKAVITQVSF